MRWGKGKGTKGGADLSPRAAGPGAGGIGPGAAGRLPEPAPGDRPRPSRTGARRRLAPARAPARRRDPAAMKAAGIRRVVGLAPVLLATLLAVVALTAARGVAAGATGGFHPPRTAKQA